MVEDVKKGQVQMAPVMIVPQPVGEDAITLLDLWRTLVRRKNIIALAAALAVAVGLGYALLATPVYRAEAHLLPPANKDVQGLNMQGLNMQGLNMQEYTPEKVYQFAIRNLNSRSLRRRFFDVNGVAEKLGGGEGNVEKLFEEGFNEPLKVLQDKKNQEHVTVAFEGDDAALAAQWVNDFLKQVQQVTVGELVADVRERIDNAKRDLRVAIAAKRKLAEQRRLDRIAELEEAILIAERMGLTENPLLMDSKGAKAITMANQPLYMMGVKALRAELGALKARKSDDPFISGLRDLQEKLVKLESAKIDPEAIKVFTIDQAAIVPEKPIKPKRTLIVILAALAGLFLGILAALLAEFVAKARQQEAESAVS